MISILFWASGVVLSFMARDFFFFLPNGEEDKSSTSCTKCNSQLSFPIMFLWASIDFVPTETSAAAVQPFLATLVIFDVAVSQA